MDQQQAKAKYEQASACFKKGEYQQALALLDELKQAFPANDAVAKTRAEVVRAMGQAPDAGATQRPVPRAGKPSLLKTKWVWIAVGLVLVAGVVAVMLTRSASPGFEIREDQFPLAAGYEWLYRAADGQESPLRITEAFERDGARVFRALEGSTNPFEQFFIIKDSTLFNNWNPDDDLPAEVLAKFPLRAGMTWKSDVLQKNRDGDPVQKECRWAAEEETIDVPAGTYQTIRVRFLDTNMTGFEGMSVWIAPDVGFVKFGNDHFMSSLVKYSLTPGAPRAEVDLSALVGRWAWFNGIDVDVEGDGFFVVVLDGNAALEDAGSRSFRFVWQNDKWVDTLVLSEDGKRLSGTNQNSQPVYGERLGSYVPSATRSLDVASLAGRWRWSDGGMTTIDRDGALAYRHDKTGHIKPGGGVEGDFRFEWPGGMFVDSLNLVDGGQRLEGRNQQGTVVSAVRISSNASGTTPAAQQKHESASPTLPSDPNAAEKIFLQALAKGNAETIRALLDQGADPNYLFHDSRGNPHRPVNIIRRRQDRDELYELLVSSGADVTLRPEVRGDWGKFTQAQEKDFFQAIVGGDVEEARRWLEVEGMDPELEAYAPEAEGCRALHIAAGAGNLELVQLLLEFGADANGEHAMDYRTSLFDASEHGHTEIARLLLSKGAKVNAKSADGGVTPLYRAVKNGHVGIARLLVKAGADVNAKNEYDGSTPLSMARDSGNSELAAALEPAGTQ